MRHTVLVVEDESDLRETMCDVLEMSGYSVVAAADGQEALDALERIDHLCVVLLDLLMPGMNGWEFYERLRKIPKYANAPVIVSSSSPERAPSGVSRRLQKPVEIDDLVAAVAAYCAE